MRVLLGCRKLWFAPLLFLADACHHLPRSVPAFPEHSASALAPYQGADSIAFGAVNFSDKLQRDRPEQFVVNLQYTLVTRDTAFLHLTLQQFRNPKSCAIIADSVQPPFVVTTEKQVPIVRGTHTLQIPISWPGDTDEGVNGNVFEPAGAISFQASMRTETVAYDFLTRRFGTEFCMQF